MLGLLPSLDLCTFVRVGADCFLRWVWNVYQALRELCRGMAWKNCLHDHPVSTLHHTSQAGLRRVGMRSLCQHF